MRIRNKCKRLTENVCKAYTSKKNLQFQYVLKSKTNKKQCDPNHSVLFETRDPPCHLSPQNTEETGERRERNKQEEEAGEGPGVGGQVGEGLS